MAYDNAKLVELFEKVQRKNYLETVLKELRENIAQLEPEVRKLMTQMYIEQEDVEKLEGNGIKAFFTALSGKKTEKLEKEREEAYDAKKKYDAANLQLETMKNDLKRYIDEYNEVRYLEPDYEKAIKEKIEYIKEMKSTAAKKIVELDEQIEDMMKKNNELRHLRTLANRAIGTAEHMKTVLTQVKKLKALIAIPETYYPMIEEGMKLTVKSEVYPNETFPATIEVVYPTIDAASHTFQCKVVIPNPTEKLRAGMYVTTTLGLGKENTIVVPYQSVEKLIGSNERYVFINENGYAKRVSVKLGQRFDENIEIIAPEIYEGVEYIYVGQRKLVDGVKIEVK